MEMFLVLLISYLLGSIPTALIVGKVGYGVDIRQLGSGNLGGTNTFRALGIKAGLIVTVVDLLKGTLAAALPSLTGVDLNPLLAGIPAVIGHCYPVFAGFRGGKAVATSAGVLLLVSPMMIVSGLFVFGLTLYISKYVSLSSMLSGVWVHTYSIVFDGYDRMLLLVTFALCLFVMYRHRGNIERIVNGTESKITWM